MGTHAQISSEDEHIFRSRFPSVPVPDDLTLPDFVLQDVELYSGKVAFVDAMTRKEYNYGQVSSDIRRFAKALRSLGLGKGDVVVVVLPNVAEYAIVALGIMAAGGMKSMHLPVIVVDEECVPGAINWDELLKARDLASIDQTDEPVYQADLCALPFSSGTTGVSKGVMLTHRNLVANLRSTLFSVIPEMIGKVTTLGLMPFFHIYGITGICCATMRNKGKVVVMGRYELRTLLNALIEHEVTFAPIVPPIILSLVKDPIVEEFDLQKLKLQAIMTAAAPLAPELLSAFENKFPGVQVQEAYGLTEHSCITVTHGNPDYIHGIAKRNSVGFILPNLEIKFIDPNSGQSLPKNTRGELCVRSQCVMQVTPSHELEITTGYYKNEEETSRILDEKGWLHTGDIGYIDDDGDVFIADRIKELIKYKGFQVPPAELEAILLGHPSVEDAAVVALPDEEAGEIPAACVVMNKTAKESEEDIINYVASNVASYKRVRVLQFVNTIPNLLLGK
ncbi:AMP-binding enzyme, C-terminal domain [Dillenia turbinata]|uniref:AMP-binding enzyme, C-terminal domain n=1 Tax=Dillenia turbinata TaxID=194707 RepID=A0AAN8VP06_9MAGN